MHTPAMRKRRKLIIFCAVLLIAYVPLVLLTRSPEPRYEGRSLTAWLIQASKAEESSAEAEAAKTAVLGIGTNALPFLLAWNHNPAASLTSRIIGVLERARTKPFGRRCIPQWLTHNAAEDRFHFAFIGLRILGPEAASAAPELARQLRRAPDYWTASTCIAELYFIGPAGIPYLCEAITNTPPRGWTNAPYLVVTSDMSPRVQAIKFLITFRTNADCVVLAFQRAIEDQDLSVALHAMLGLGLCGSGHPATVPALTKALLDRRPLIRAGAADALCRLGPEAYPGVPALLRALHDEDPTVRQSATKALTSIAPQILSNAPDR